MTFRSALKMVYSVASNDYRIRQVNPAGSEIGAVAWAVVWHVNSLDVQASQRPALAEQAATRFLHQWLGIADSAVLSA